MTLQNEHVRMLNSLIFDERVSDWKKGHVLQLILGIILCETINQTCFET